MKIYILGTDHEIQTFDGSRTAEEKTEFEKLLRSLVAEHRIEFVGDETYPDKTLLPNPSRSLSIFGGGN